MPAFPGFGVPQIPQNYFTDSVDVQSTAIPDDIGGGMDIMASLMGIQMPSFPQQDAMGRYGINDTQRKNAGNKGLAQALYGAAGSFMGGGAEPALRGGMNAGLAREQYLDKASAQNMLDYEARVKNTMAQLAVLEGKSNLELNTMKLKQASMDLEKSKRDREIVSTYMQEMEPVADEIIRDAYNVGELFGGEVHREFMKVKQLANAGNLQDAENSIQNIYAKFLTVDPSGKMAAQAKMKLETATLQGMLKYQMDVDAIQKFMQDNNMQGYSIELGPNGAPTVVNPFEQSERAARLATQSATADNLRAEADYRRARAAAAGSITPTEISKQVAASVKAIAILANKTPPKDEKAKMKWETDREWARIKLIESGVNPDDPASVKSYAELDIRGKSARAAESAGKLLQAAESGMYGGGGGYGGGNYGAPNPEVDAVRALAILKKGTTEAVSDEDALQVLDIIARTGFGPAIAAMQKYEGLAPLAKLQAINKELNPISPNRNAKQ